MAGPRILLGSLLIAAVAATAAAASAPSRPTLSVDLDGDGSIESVTAKLARRGVDVDVRSAAGKKIATVMAPAPRSRAAESISLASGSAGSAGALLEVIATSAEEECRSVWRLVRGQLLRVPVGGEAAPLPDCGKPGEWTWSWDRPSGSEPAVYRREHTRETAEGTHHQVESFRLAGARLEPDPARSAAEIRGVTIPSWFPAKLYPKDALDFLYQRIELSNLRKATRLVWRADPAAGVFSLEVDSASGREKLPVRGIEKGEMRNEYLARVGFRDSERQVRVTVAGPSAAPVETLLAGFDASLDGLYKPVMKMSDGGLLVYSSASEELATSLAGSWSGAKGETMAMSIASGEPFLLQIGKTRCRIDLESSPDGFDFLAIPTDGSAPFGFVLRGPNSLERVAMKCGEASPGTPTRECHSAGPGEQFHRVGARLNVR